MSDLYINRKLYCEQQPIRDHEVLQKTGVLVVLAEPGAGKTDFLAYLSRGLGVPRELATVFAHDSIQPKATLIVDALDEVARTDESGTNRILVKARDSGASTVILASRSYVWDEARTQFTRDCFGIEPIILRLEPFNEDEQRQLFEDQLPGEDFAAFRDEAERFELTPLLGNPQFLQLFADAYIEGGRHFSTKHQIYIDAVYRLATENKNTGGQRDRPETDKIVAAASEIYAKLLLSGSVGVSALEGLGDDDYPYLLSVGSGDGILPFVLNTRLFKPTESTGRHEPVHRIVAEYCAASFLVKRIEDPTNTLSTHRCLAIIAPNSAVRDELRGMLGWMASLGGRAVQEAVIDLDPYAVFANGDPSQLLAASKRRLLLGFESLASIDPFFRRMDAWRRFSVAGFFTKDIVDDVRRLLKSSDSKSHLKSLLLELLEDSEAALDLQDELRALMLDPGLEADQRLRAHRSLIGISTHDHAADFDTLVAEGSMDSLRIASEMVATIGATSLGAGKILSLLNALTTLYPANGKRERTLGSRYFIKQLISVFEPNNVSLFLDEITKGITCVCGKVEPYRCSCRAGKSKIAGLLLDRYFETAMGPHDPRRIAAWTKPLIFREGISEERSASVQALGSNDGLRRAVQLSAFDGLASQEDLSNAAMWFYMSYSHAGLTMRQGDIRAIVDHAAACGNIPLWEQFFAGHNIHSERKGVDELRSHMRAQAHRSPELLRIWSRLDRKRRMAMRKEDFRWRRSSKRYSRTEATRREERFEHLRQHRAQIEAGRHWWWLENFALHYLYRHEKVSEIVDDPQTMERALLNCFDFVRPHVPSLEMLSEGRSRNVAMVLHAACLAKLRQNGSLAGIDIDVLQAVKTDGVGGEGYQEGEAQKFEAELDNLLFRSDQDAIDFATRYIEPQLSRPDDTATQIHIIENRSAFGAVKGRLALDWLTRYPRMPFNALGTLFGIAAQHSDRAALNALVDARCKDAGDTLDGADRRRKFWLLRHFFFIAPTSDVFWAEYSADPKAIFGIEHYAGHISRHDAAGWPPLGAEKTYRVLDAFVDHWPKVELPSSWGTGDPEEETAYRFLSEVIYQIGQDDPSVAIPIFDRILADSRFSQFNSHMKSEKAASTRKLALSGYRPPKPREIARLLDESKIASVEDLRALFGELLGEIQFRIKGAATDPVDVFYSGEKRVDENTARNRIVEMLEARLNALNLSVVVEHHMNDSNRCDLTASTVVGGRPIVLVVEIKGQWNDKLYTAASAQLAERYIIYPGAAHQGIYLVLWFGGDETIAGKRTASITTPDQLRQSIIASMPDTLRGVIDVVVLDVWRPTAGWKKRSRKAKPKSTV